jgi:hypothetical protein
MLSGDVSSELDKDIGHIRRSAFSAPILANEPWQVFAKRIPGRRFRRKWIMELDQGLHVNLNSR